MAVVDTSNFGKLEYQEDAALVFPRGLPGFEDARGFLPVHQPENDPLIFLQSLEDSSVCFVTVPILVVDPDYRLEIENEDRETIGLAPRRPRIGQDVLCLAVLSLREEGPTANLRAPVVVNLANRQGVQAVARRGGYSHRQPLCAPEALAC